VPAAAKGQAPLLLVTPSGIPSEVDAELRRLNPSSIVVLGGETAVSKIVYGLLAGYTST
jgi:putative cell wall-binding protein